MAKLDNVETLQADGGSPGELAVDLRKWAEDGSIVDVVILSRGPDGALGLMFSPQDSAELSELASYLSAFVQNAVWRENVPPVEEECDGE